MKPKAVFWDMDGTLIDSEPYWHQAEIEIAHEHGGEWDEELGWQHSGFPVPLCAQAMIDHGTQLAAPVIVTMLIERVAQLEEERMPWIPGTVELLIELAKHGIPSILVTASPRRMAEAAVRQAPDNVFAGFVCGDDNIPKKPDPGPYLQACKVANVPLSDIQQCIALEDSRPGLQSALASGATTVAITGYSKSPNAYGHEFASIETYAQTSVKMLSELIERRCIQQD
ncbi:HAD family hydrolase [Bifidobacterium aquikefiricola]|uniref:HAD family phosphatase n=1 Tax=Bifidobacterium aquikefiricola TaxID=3059038 RepID=A0AB39U6G0_9BIFI